MHVVRQDDPGVDMERTLYPCEANGLAQRLDLAGQRIGSGCREGDGEIDGGAGTMGAKIAGHGGQDAREWLTNACGGP